MGQHSIGTELTFEDITEKEEARARRMLTRLAKGDEKALRDAAEALGLTPYKRGRSHAKVGKAVA